MSRICTICSHEKRAEIESEIASGKSFRGIARHFAVGPDSVERHAAEHLPRAIKQFQAAREEAQALDVVKQLKTINAVTFAILQEARTAKQNGIALFAIDRVMKQLELQSKLLADTDAQEPEQEDGIFIPFGKLSPHARMEIRRVLVEDEQRREAAS